MPPDDPGEALKAQRRIIARAALAAPDATNLTAIYSDGMRHIRIVLAVTRHPSLQLAHARIKRCEMPMRKLLPQSVRDLHTALGLRIHS